VQWGLWYVSFTRAQHLVALEAAERLLETVRSGDDPGLLLEAHHALWPTLAAMGRPLQAIAHAERGIALYDPERDAAQRFLYGGHDAGACCRYHLAAMRWLAGQPDRALRELKDALRLVADLNHPQTTLLANYFAGWVYFQRGDLEPAIALYEQAQSLVKQYGNPRYSEHLGAVLHCYGDERLNFDALTAFSEVQMANPWSSWQKIFSMCMLALRFAESGHPEQGIALLRATKRDSSHSCIAPEVLRLEGELLMLMNQPDPLMAEQRMREAIELARRQESKSLELRAATALARLLSLQGRHEEARGALTEIYGWFTEGFDTADLKAAKALLADPA
jgi:tetratricopeptide (TPR) repeat protein